MTSARCALLATCLAHAAFAQQNGDTTANRSTPGKSGGDKPPPLVLRVGLPSADSFTFATRSPNFRTTIPIEADTDGDFTVSVSPLIGPDGVIVPVTFGIDSATPDAVTRKVSIKRFGSANLVVLATLPATGAYRGAVTTVTHTARVTRAFTLTYPRRERPVRVAALGAAPFDRTSGPLDVTVAVVDTSLAAVRLYPRP